MLSSLLLLLKTLQLLFENLLALTLLVQDKGFFKKLNSLGSFAELQVSVCNVLCYHRVIGCPLVGFHELF
jgi:hypothetical protein